MERSPRSAGVRRAQASMGQYHTLRFFVISLAIAIALTKSPANGFTIPQKILDTVPDLETAESTQLEVRYDLNTLNENKAINISKNKIGADSTVIAINDPKNVDKKIDNNENITATTQFVNETTDIQTQKSADNTFEIRSESSKLMSTETVSYSYPTSVPSTSQTTTREPEKGQEFSTKSTSHTTTATESQILSLKEFSNSTPDDFLEQEIMENKTTEIQNSSESKITPVKQNFTDSTEKQETTNVTNNISNTSDHLNDVTEADSFTARKDVARSILEYNSRVPNDTRPVNGSFFYLNEFNRTSSGLNIDEESSTTSTDTSLDTTTTSSSEPATDVTKVMFETTTPEVDITTGSYNTETVNTDFNLRTLPSWKKYTTIDRKRTITEDTTASNKDMVRAETGQTRVSLEKVFSNTPIPSLEKLRNDLINARESTSSKLELINATDINMANATDLETSTTQMMTTPIETETSKLEIVSKRAGYIDNKETTTPKPEEATTSEFPLKVSVNDTEMFSAMYETEPGDVDVTENKNATGFESQSQLAEDAIKEELLREETLNDNEENAQRHREESALPKVKPLNDRKTTENVATVRELVTEDMLSVKPISFDKKKNPALYAVSPNYKPLKKIDVQPPKQFVRDPDDNSWRNESISSLGIVFKPKNASKSFTEVLKNKTETELGNMTDKDNKGDVLDLRVRLEKIAEVRKRKKKINKFGDTVYSDYEDSGENVNSSKEDVTSPMSRSAETLLSSTTPIASNSSTTEFDLTVNAIFKDNFDLFKHQGTTPLTTDKPKKFNNLAEYYDTTDEYDADYLNLSKIDLKKFTKPFKATESLATQPPELIRTTPMREYQPERKGTVQYFPPTQKVAQKVNLNDYDTGFNRKINLYTYKESPKNVLSVSYGTVSPMQTENIEQMNKISVTPSFTPMYKTENMDKNLYLTNQPRMTEPPSGFVVNDGNFNRASYVIKHYRDFINEAAKEGEDDRNGEFGPYTEAPLQGVTISDLAKMTTLRDSNPGEEEYDYDVKFRKDILNRFVDNFNQNSERFKVDFPILYNNSVVHTKTTGNGKVLASSSAFMKRLYEVGNPKPTQTRPCDPHCENLMVELSPAYELHYYVPDQEEKEEIEPRPATVPYRYRL